MLNPTSNGFIKLLSDRLFLALWTSQVLSQLADKILLVLLIAIAADYQSNSVPINSRESLLMLASTIPAILFGSIAGIYVDRYPKRLIMIGCNLGRGVLVLLIPFLPKILGLLLLITFLISTLTQAFAPAEQSTIPLLVPESNLMSANALFTITMMGAMIIGFAIGSPLLGWLTKILPAWSGCGRELFIGGMYMISGMILFQLPKTKITAQHYPHVFQDLKDGFNYLRQNPLISGAIIQLVILYSVFAALLKLSINLTELITNNRADFGFLLAAAGLGLGIGALLLGQFGDRLAHRPLPLVGFIGMSLMLAMFCFVSDLWLALLLAGILGFNGALVAVPMQTAIQQYTPEHMRGKVFGLLNNAENIAVSLPLAFAAVALDLSTSALGELHGLQLVMIICSAIVLGMGMWAWSHTHKALTHG